MVGVFRLKVRIRAAGFKGFSVRVTVKSERWCTCGV